MCFLIKKFYDDKKKYLYDRLFVLNRNFTTEHNKIDLKLQIFLGFKVKWHLNIIFFNLVVQAQKLNIDFKT